MRIGLTAQLHGRRDSGRQPPSWEFLRELALTAEEVGFDSFVFEDALLYRTEDLTEGCWEAVSVAGALAAVTNRIEIGPSVFNAPYRSPAMLAKIAETLDEIAGGRLMFGIGAGNAFDSDYEAFGFPLDHRYSRFEEAIQIIHPLLKTGEVDFEGRYHFARRSELHPRGPRTGGPPINIAAGGPKMMRLAARYADAWNWWNWGVEGSLDALRPKVEELERACQEEGRDPATLRRTVDVYSFDTDGNSGEDQAMTGSVEDFAQAILSYRELEFDEVRVDLYPKDAAAVEWFAPVVELVHQG